jgi:hypothetical protein
VVLYGQQGFIGKQAVSQDAGEQSCGKTHGRAVMLVFNLAEVFELIEHCLCQRAA